MESENACVRRNFNLTLPVPVEAFFPLNRVIFTSGI